MMLFAEVDVLSLPLLPPHPQWQQGQGRGQQAGGVYGSRGRSRRIVEVIVSTPQKFNRMCRIDCGNVIVCGKGAKIEGDVWLSTVMQREHCHWIQDTAGMSSHWTQYWWWQCDDDNDGGWQRGGGCHCWHHTTRARGEDTCWEDHQGKDADNSIVVEGLGQDAQLWIKVVGPHHCCCVPYSRTTTRAWWST